MFQFLIFLFLRSLEMFAPKKYSQMMKTFNHGKDCKKNHKCGYF